MATENPYSCPSVTLNLLTPTVINLSSSHGADLSLSAAGIDSLDYADWMKVLLRSSLPVCKGPLHVIYVFPDSEYFFSCASVKICIVGLIHL